MNSAIEFLLDGEKLKVDVDIEAPPNVVYVFYFEKNGSRTPFYVGQTYRFSGRLNDYKIGSYGAPADFRVHHAIKYFVKNGYKITVETEANIQEEGERINAERQKITELLKRGPQLLNSFPSYNYKISEKDNEEKLVHEICDVIIRKAS